MSAYREFETVTVQAGEGHCLEDSRARTPVVTLALTAGLLARGRRCTGRVQRWVGCYTALRPQKAACQRNGCKLVRLTGSCRMKVFVFAIHFHVFVIPCTHFCHTPYTFLSFSCPLVFGPQREVVGRSKDCRAQD